MPTLAELQVRLGWNFRDGNLLRLALTHPSVAHEQDHPAPHNQRLEFLGDSVIGLVITRELYHKFPQANEGTLTKSRAKLVNAASLTAHGRALALGAHLILSGGHREIVHFDSLEAFQNWYAGVLNAAQPLEAFVNVPISQLEGEYLLLRAGSIIGLRIEPIFAAQDD